MDRWCHAIRSSLTSRMFVVLMVIGALYIFAGYGAAAYYNWPVMINSQLYSKPFQYGVLFFFLGFITWRSFYIMIVQRPAHPAIEIWKDLKTDYLTPERLACGIPVVIFFCILFSLFTSFKSMIPEINPFRYDALFSDIDKAIHFGKQPWEWLFPITRIAIVTTILSFIYKTWFVAKFSILFWQAFSIGNPGLRERFFVTYILSWIINGTLLATLLSSAGPCYYGFIVDGGNDPYGVLIEFLHKTNDVMPVWDLFAQDYLWRMYQDHGVQLFSGISAMPSMHISLSFLFALLGWSVGRKTGIFFTAYLILMMIGSVHLGWHYAIDGYFSIISTALMWWGVGAWQKKFPPENKKPA